MSEAIDPREIHDLYRAFENADYFIRKKYRDKLDQYPICDLPDWLAKNLSETPNVGDNVIGDNVQFVRIEKIVYDKAENISDKLTTVYHTLSSFENTSIVLVLISNVKEVELYLGAIERSSDGKINKDSRGSKAKTLTTAFEANFPGSLLADKIKLDGKIKPIRSIDVIDKAFDGVLSISSVTGIASVRNKDSKENDQFVQGMEKLIDSMRGKKYSAVFIADCKGADEIETICTSYEDIYSSLYPFLQSQQTIGTTEGITDTESFIEGVTDTTNESVAKSLSKSHTVGKSSSDTVGGSVTVGGSSGIFPGPNASVSANYSHTWSRNESDTRTDTDTTTTGTAQSLSKQNSVAKSIAKSTNEGLQITYQNRAVKTLLDIIDEQIKHLRACEAFGVFDFSCYFMAEEGAISRAAASVYDSLMRGEDSGAELSAVTTWYDDEARKAAAFLKRFYHPLVAVPNFSKTPDENGMIEFLPVTPSTIISGKEIALHMAMPKKSVAGLPITKCADFGRNVMSLDDDRSNVGLSLGEIYHMQKTESTPVALDVNSLTMHTFITGSTGSGKSNTVYQLLSQLRDHKAKFLVIEPAKGEYKNIFGSRDDVHVYGTNPALTELLRIDPFSFPEGVHIYEHMDRLIEIFNVCWPMYAAMPAVLKDAIERAYINAGWNLKTSQNAYNSGLFPTFADVLDQIDIVMNESQYSSDSKGDYKGALSTRLKSLTNGINGLIFCSNEISSHELFDKNVIVDLSRVGSTETKSMIMGLLVMKLQEYRMTSSGMNDNLKHVTVLEEAHNLLKRTSTEQSSEGSNLIGKSVEMLTNAIAEMRTYGEGFIIADQAPGLLDMAVIRNTNTKIVLRLPEYSDRELVGKAMGLNDDQIDELAKLRKGVAAVYQNDWVESVLCEVEHFVDYEKGFNYHNGSSLAEDNSLKGKILSSIIANKIYNMIEPSESDAIISAPIPSKLKASLLKYLNSNDDEKLSIAAYTVHELLNFKTISAKINAIKLPEDQNAVVCKHLERELSTLPKQYHEIFMCLAVYWQSHETQNPETRILAEGLIKDFRERGTIR